MSLPNILTQFQKPLIRKKQLLPIILLFLLLILGLGAAYYFYLQGEERRLTQYKIKQLDNFYNQLEKRLKNDQEKEESLEDTLSKDGKIDEDTTDRHRKEQFTKSDKVQDCKLLTTEANSDCLDRFIQKQRRSNTDFDDFMVLLQAETGTAVGMSFLGVEKEGIRTLILDEKNIWNGKVDSIEVNQESYFTFSKSYSNGNGIKIYLVGFIKESNFKQSVRSLNPWLVALLTSLLLLILIGLPFLKLYFISEDERLYSYDVIFAGLSTVLGAPILLFIVLSASDFASEYYYQKPQKLNQLGEKVASRFYEENHEKLEAIFKFDFNSYGDGDTTNPIYVAPKNGYDLLEHFKYVTQTNLNGKVKYHINYIEEPSSNPKNLSERSYYEAISKKENLWRFKGHEYVMRPVVSIEQGIEEAVYAVKVNESDIGIFSTQLSSLHQPFLPLGYSYAVVDQEGEVWFHSDLGKSTLENFFDLSNELDELQSSVNRRISSNGEIEYHGKSQLYYTTPLKGTNLSVIALYDVSFLGSKLSEVLSIGSILFLLLTIFMGLMVLVSVFLKNPKWGIIKFPHFPFQFLVPERGKNNAYLYLTVIFTLTFVLSILLINADQFKTGTLLSIASFIVVGSYLLSYFVLKKVQFNLTTVALLLFPIAIIIMIYINAEGGEKLIFIIIFLSLFLIILLSKLPVVKSRLLKSESNQTNNISYKYHYVWFLSSWLLSSAIFPAYLLYQGAFRLNQSVWDKANLFELVDGFRIKRDFLQNEVYKPASIASEDSSEYSFVYDKLIRRCLSNSNYYLDSTSNVEQNSINKELKNNRQFYKLYLDNHQLLLSKPNFDENWRIHDLFWKIRPIYSQKLKCYRPFIYNHAYDYKWTAFKSKEALEFKLFIDENSYYKASLITISNTNSSVFAKIFSGFCGLLFEDKDSDYVLILSRSIMVAVLLVLLYWLILFYVDRCYGFRYFNLSPSRIDSNQTNFAETLKSILDYKTKNSGLFIIGVSSTGKNLFTKGLLEGFTVKAISLSQLANYAPKKPFREILAELFNVEQEDGESAILNYDYYHLQNFEHNIISFEQNRLKALLISFLIAHDKKIVITSEVYLSQLTDVYVDQTNRQGELDAELASDYNMWRDILGGFAQVLLGINEDKEKVNLSLKQVEVEKYDTVSLDLIKKEFGFSNFLPSLAPLVLEKCKYKPARYNSSLYIIDEQRMVMHGMMLAHGYYQDIWNSLARREKYILYDLAKDGFMNVKNSSSLFSLMKKGLVIWRGVPKLFNASFRNFVLTNGKQDIQLTEEFRDKGVKSWGTIRIMVFLIILALLVFILFSRPEIVSDLKTFYGTISILGAIIPIMSSVLGRGGRS